MALLYLATINPEKAGFRSKLTAGCFRKKMMLKQAEYEEQIEIMLQKISQLEKAKSRLQSEVEVLIVDLEKAQNHIQVCSIYIAN